MTRILYVEDNDDNVYMLKMRLELTDEFEVLVAEDGERGCEMATQEKPDLILMDLELPGVDGWDAPAQGQPGDPRHPGDRALRPCARRLARDGARRRLRRVRHQAGGIRAPPGQGPEIARAVGRPVTLRR